MYHMNFTFFNFWLEFVNNAVVTCEWFFDVVHLLFLMLWLHSNSHFVYVFVHEFLEHNFVIMNKFTRIKNNKKNDCQNM